MDNFERSLSALTGLCQSRKEIDELTALGRVVLPMLRSAWEDGAKCRDEEHRRLMTAVYNMIQVVVDTLEPHAEVFEGAANTRDALVRALAFIAASQMEESDA